MAFRLPYIKPFVRSTGCSLMILSYRGYGESGGSPSERGLQMDAQVSKCSRADCISGGGWGLRGARGGEPCEAFDAPVLGDTQAEVAEAG